MDKTLVFGGVGLLLTLAVVYVATRPAASAPPLTAAPDPVVNQGPLSDSTGDTLRGAGQLLNGLGGGFVNVFGEVRRQDRADATALRTEDRADRRLALEEATATRGSSTNGTTGRGT